MNVYFELYDRGVAVSHDPRGKVTRNKLETPNLAFISYLKNYTSYVYVNNWQATSTLSIKFPYSYTLANLISVRPGVYNETDITAQNRYIDWGTTSTIKRTSYGQAILMRNPDGSLHTDSLFIITGLKVSTSENEIEVNCESYDRIYYKSFRRRLYANNNGSVLVGGSSYTRLAIAQSFIRAIPSGKAAVLPTWAYPPEVPVFNSVDTTLIPQSLYDALSLRTGTVKAQTAFGSAKSDYEAFCAAIDYDPNGAWPYTEDNYYRPLSAKYDFKLSFSDEILNSSWNQNYKTRSTFSIVEERNRTDIVLSLANASLNSVQYEYDVSSYKPFCTVPRSNVSLKFYYTSPNSASTIVLPPTDCAWPEETLPEYINGYQSSDTPDYYKEWLKSVGSAINKGPYTSFGTTASRKSYYRTITVDATTQTGLYVPGRDYIPGDVVTIALSDEEWLPALCVSIDETEDSSGYTIHPNFEIYSDCKVTNTNVE